MKEKFLNNKRYLLLLILIIISVIILIVRIFFSSDSGNIEIVKSSSQFYTVNGCIDRYLGYLNSGDVDSLMIILDNSYIKSNGINKNNIFKKIDKMDSYMSFEARKMYQKTISKNKIMYYIMGYISENKMFDDNDTKKISYFIVNFNNKKDTYSITPYNGDIFENGDKYE